MPFPICIAVRPVSYTHLEILLRKIDEGVEVKFMYDDFGAAIRTGKYFKRVLEDEGFEVRVFNPCLLYTSRCV